MNAHSTIPLAPEHPAQTRQNSLRSAERFTGRFLRTFAELEFWLVGRLNKAEPGAKVGKLISQRIEALGKALVAHPEIVVAPDAVRTLLDRLQPYVQLRTLLAHSRVTALSGEDEAIFLFETATPLVDDPAKVRTVLRSGEFETLRTGLSELIKALEQQTPHGPPSPPREAKPHGQADQVKPGGGAVLSL